AVFLSKLIKRLDTEDDADLVLTAGGQGGVHVEGMETWEFVDIDLAGGATRSVDRLQHSADEQTDDRAIDVLFLRIGTETNDLGSGGIIDVQAEIIGGKQ